MAASYQVTAAAKLRKSSSPSAPASSPIVRVPPGRGKEGVNKFCVTKPWQQSINKTACQSRTILWAASASCQFGGWKTWEGGMCARKRSASPCQGFGDPTPGVRVGASSPPRPTIQTEKEAKTPKNRVSSEICPCVLHSRKDLNENHEIEKHLYLSSGFKKLRLVLKDHLQRGSGPTAFARTRSSGTPSTGRKLMSRAAGGQAGGLSFTGPQVESPVPSCVSRLHHSDQLLASR